MLIQPEETEIIGHWHTSHGVVEADPAAKRIEQLIRIHLTKVASASGGWEALFKDPVDQRLWELSYPQSEVHGGGPPTLRVIPEEAARSKYLR